MVQGVREKVISAAADVVQAAVAQAEKEGVTSHLDYVQLNWADTLEPVDAFERSTVSSNEQGSGEGGRVVLLSGAMWVGRTRLIDNMVLGHDDVIGHVIS